MKGRRLLLGGRYVQGPLGPRSGARRRTASSPITRNFQSLFIFVSTPPCGVLWLTTLKGFTSFWEASTYIGSLRPYFAVYVGAPGSSPIIRNFKSTFDYLIQHFVDIPRSILQGWVGGHTRRDRTARAHACIRTMSFTRTYSDRFHLCSLCTCC